MNSLGGVGSIAANFHLLGRDSVPTETAQDDDDADEVKLGQNCAVNLKSLQ